MFTTPKLFAILRVVISKAPNPYCICSTQKNEKNAGQGARSLRGQGAACPPAGGRPLRVWAAPTVLKLFE